MSAPVAEGDIVLDKYRVERVLGQGGMGVVIAATHVELDQRVALKFLLPGALEHADLVERFAREAKAAAKIQSQHVVRVLDTGRMPNGAPFMVMEYLEGEDLAAILKRSGLLEPNVVADYLLQACEAIGEAHAAGIVHRDLKPSNLFLAKQRDRRSLVKVLDFGISKLVEPDAARLTQTTAAMGSPHYMSPEQLISSKHVDPRSDIWSLGVIVYELVSGSRPFGGDTMPEVVAQVLNNEPERLSALRADVSLDLELVVARCLATDTKDRYQNVAELAAALLPFATDPAMAAASVERITRVLGGASIPPPAPDAAANAGMVIVVNVPEPGEKEDADPQAAATVRPAKAKAVKVPTATTAIERAAAAPPAVASSAVASSSVASAERADAKPEGALELAHAATTPSNELSAAVRAARAGADPPPSRAGVLALGGAVLCLVAFAGIRVGMSRPSVDPGVERTREPPREITRSAAPSSSASPDPAASAPVASTVPVASIAVASASASASAASTAAAGAPSSAPSSAHSSTGATSTSRPIARPIGVPTGSARPLSSRDSIQMDIK